MVVGVPTVEAQTLQSDLKAIYRAEVIKITSQNTKILPGTDATFENQTLEIKIITGPEKGKELTLENDYQPLEIGDKFFIQVINLDGMPAYSISDPDRRWPLVVLSLLFVFIVLVFGGWQGLRSLVSLVGSLAVIIFILIPWLMSGAEPVMVSSVVSVIILSLAIFSTHGFNRQSASALMGTVAAVVITGVVAAVAVSATKLTGLAADEAVYLNLGTAGELNFRGLLLGAMIIGMLGVLDDIAVTQASVVAELKHALPSASGKDIYGRAIKVGREHVGALVNTLVLAYAGSSLPLLLLFSLSDFSPFLIINREIFTAEIVRTLVGSIGLILTVPLSTALAVWLVPAGEGHHHHH
ncbi:MAG: YibE/F family protein [Candidatus Pacebacteria bacterium]|nr:YibE/F family protein [Candidatus Paceibacterota bacterium]